MDYSIEFVIMSTIRVRMHADMADDRDRGLKR